MTTSRFLGMSRSMFLRLCVRAPRTRISAVPTSGLRRSFRSRGRLIVAWEGGGIGSGRRTEHDNGATLGGASRGPPAGAQGAGAVRVVRRRSAAAGRSAACQRLAAACRARRRRCTRAAVDPDDRGESTALTRRSVVAPSRPRRRRARRRRRAAPPPPSGASARCRGVELREPGAPARVERDGIAAGGLAATSARARPRSPRARARGARRARRRQRARAMSAHGARSRLGAGRVAAPAMRVAAACLLASQRRRRPARAATGAASARSRAGARGAAPAASPVASELAAALGRRSGADGRRGAACDRLAAARRGGALDGIGGARSIASTSFFLASFAAPASSDLRPLDGISRCVSAEGNGAGASFFASAAGAIAPWRADRPCAAPARPTARHAGHRRAGLLRAALRWRDAPWPPSSPPRSSARRSASARRRRSTRSASQPALRPARVPRGRRDRRRMAPSVQRDGAARIALARRRRAGAACVSSIGRSHHIRPTSVAAITLAKLAATGGRASQSQKAANGFACALA